MELIYEGKAKRLYQTENPNELLMEFKDDATAFNGQKRASLENKGTTNRQMSTLLYELLSGAGVPNHFVRDVDSIRTVVKRVDIIQVEVVVRNHVAGSLAKRTGLEEGAKLKQPVIEMYYKNDDLGDPLINRDHIRELELATPDELEKMKRLAHRINGILLPFFAKAGILLVDFKLEFGRLFPDCKNIILADEISADTCRFWDMETGERLDKDRFRQDMGSVIESYTEVLKRATDAVNS